MPTYEGLRLKVLKMKRDAFANLRRKRLYNTEFTIISNNCWGGMIYESYNLPKQSPTAGLFFMAEDYVEFLSDLKGFINGNLTFIEPEKSRWIDTPQISGDKRFGSYPVGVLSNGKKRIEIFFLHYQTQQEAREKWERRCQRIHWDKLLVKFNDQNGCTEEDFGKYISLSYKNKLFFTCKEWPNSPVGGYIKIKQFPRHDCIMASYEPFGKNKYLDVTSLINSL